MSLGYLITGRNEIVAMVIFLHLSVILFTGGRGVGFCFNACWDTNPPPPTRQPPPRTRQTRPGTRPPPGPGRPPLTRQTPPGPDPPGSGRPPPGTRPPRTGRSPRDQTPPPPRETDSSIRSTSGRYASYWNAFLFMKLVSRLGYQEFSSSFNTPVTMNSLGCLNCDRGYQDQQFGNLVGLPRFFLKP